jgi:cysteine desulfurase
LFRNVVGTIQSNFTKALVKGAVMQTLRGYFDYNATTPLSSQVRDAMSEAFGIFGNPSSRYRCAGSSKDLIADARRQVAALLNAKTDEIIFTSGGTEANNMAIKGMLWRYIKTPGHIITSEFEHPSVLATVEFFVQEFGFEVSYIKPNSKGVIELQSVEKSIRSDTQLISIMLANNEVGSIQPIKEIAKLARQCKIFFHVDAVQGVGKIPVDVNDLGCDSLSFSSHKFYGPKGVGGLYVTTDSSVPTLIHGGGQESGMRGGTENIIAIAGTGEAALEAYQNLSSWDEKQSAIKESLIAKLQEVVPDVIVNSPASRELSVPNTLNISIPGVRGEALAALLDHRFEISVAVGSACSNNKTTQLSHVLVSMGLSEKRIKSAIRISFGRYTEEDDIENLVEALAQTSFQLRQIASPKKQRKVVAA